MKAPSKNPYVKARKSADRANRLAVKPLGVKLSKGKGIKSLAAERSLSVAANSAAARVSRTPRGLPAIKGELIPQMPSTYVGRLSTVMDWHKQVGKIFREMRRHQIDSLEGTRFIYVANVGATLARFIEEKPPLITAETDLSRLDDADMAQLEWLLAKAAGPAAMERLEAAKPNPDWRRDESDDE